MRRPRVRIWMLMVAVAAAGFSFSAPRMYLRAAHYRALAKYHAGCVWRSRREYEEITRKYKGITPDSPGKHFYEELNPAERWLRRIAYHDRLQHKYDRAARYPWLSVAPDP